jgi:retron-type reverse transcriptase
MKRIGNLFNEICKIENLQLADAKARKGKRYTHGVINHDKKQESNILKIQECLLNKTFKTSKYNVFKIFEPKERIISVLPYFPDRIVHHAIMNILEPIFVSMFTSNTFNCIKGRGIHGAANAVKLSLKDTENTKYCLKLDIKKFYPNINHDILKTIIRRKFKDNDLLWLLDDIIESSDGIPIGNYTSQFFANLYLTYFDHWIKETLKIKYYFRYADDIVIFSSCKKQLHEILAKIREYFNQKLALTIKENYQIFLVSTRGVDFVGYVFFHTHTLLRKSIKKAFARMLKKRKQQQSISAYNGWLIHCDAKHLTKKLNFKNN